MTRDPSRVTVSGPLAVHAASLCEALAQWGYPPERAAKHMQLLAGLSRWLDGHGLGAEGLTEARVADFLQERRAAGYAEVLSTRWVVKLLGSVPALAVASAVPNVSSTAEAVIEHYRRYLDEERGLATTTARAYLSWARLFLSVLEDDDGDLDCSQVTAAEVRTFVVEECRRRNVGSAQALVVALRSLLRFLFLERYVNTPLAAAVPAVSAPKGYLPRALDADAVAALLASCDTSTTRGSRDLAILTLLSRLGLRAGEVAGLTLDDVDWHHGELVVRGKGSRSDHLPLLTDVGETLAAYLMNGRPRTDSRALFLRVAAPLRAMTASNVSEIVRSACRRAGVPPARAHRLRHSAATAMQLSTVAPAASFDRVKNRGSARETGSLAAA